ncbi:MULTISPECIES: hypothetical protein [Sphingomonas]|jgi:hypothetical protein|uniref:Uncharacterized protein n=1 Tax=Sphingomonas abaci TaxID=237611 RepID=A0A7W7EYY6_9SPHN|nr:MULTISPECIES: hypothetical protein [Sphingomonas]ATI56828.1 hypothetical protein CP552_14425 [Sphingomonas melonis]MBB4619172.1 hypothetical protein [Sphingomonas abaci]MBX8846467.1 hypothetical protein [Sphingomonas melonis]MBX8855583.1 hypothetical protein [Sphingomonas melonis]MBX8900592.1 hypothetical protein [Sphingomonas melonis]
MDIDPAIAAARAEVARLTRYLERRKDFLDALDWHALPDEIARQSAMLDDLLAGDLADAVLYRDWLEKRAADGHHLATGILRFEPRPRPWHPEWNTLAA